MAKSIPKKEPARLRSSNEQIEIILYGCRQNERAAQKKLYHRYYRYAMSIALQYSSNHNNAVEMINDAFLKIFRDLKKFVPRYNNTSSSFTAWFKQVVIYACIDHLRKYNKKEMMASADPAQELIEDPRQNVEQILQHKEIIHCIQQLSPAYKTVFNLYAIQGFSHAEIADKLNISLGTSKSNFHKARQNLQALLKKKNIIRYSTSI
ncbi:MAG: RNA polymerase sigma factor [Ferruginibacter sp.]